MTGDPMQPVPQGGKLTLTRDDGEVVFEMDFEPDHWALLLRAATTKLISEALVAAMSATLGQDAVLQVEPPEVDTD